MVPLRVDAPLGGALLVFFNLHLTIFHSGWHNTSVFALDSLLFGNSQLKPLLFLSFSTLTNFLTSIFHYCVLFPPPILTVTHIFVESSTNATFSGSASLKSCFVLFRRPLYFLSSFSWKISHTIFSSKHLLLNHIIRVYVFTSSIPI